MWKLLKETVYRPDKCWKQTQIWYDMSQSWVKSIYTSSLTVFFTIKLQRDKQTHDFHISTVLHLDSNISPGSLKVSAFITQNQSLYKFIGLFGLKHKLSKNNLYLEKKWGLKSSTQPNKASHTHTKPNVIYHTSHFYS